MSESPVKSPVKRKVPEDEPGAESENGELVINEASQDESTDDGPTPVPEKNKTDDAKASGHQITPGVSLPEKAIPTNKLNPEDDPHYIRAVSSGAQAKRVKTEESEDGSGDSAVQRRVLEPQQERVKYFPAAKNDQRRLIVILEKANLETIKTRPSSLKGEDGFKNFEGHELLNCDDHMNLIKKFRKDPAFCRPDITHQCLLMLMDSPLNRAGLLQVYIHTMNNVLIEIHPQTRLPRTFKRFANLMVQLLHKLSIRSNSKDRHKLLSVIKNPITSHLPPGCRKIGTSYSKFQDPGKLMHPRQLADFARRPADPMGPPASFLRQLPYDHKDDGPVCVVIGAMAHGSIEDMDYIDECVSISKYPLSAALTATKIVSAFEEVWGIH